MQPIGLNWLPGGREVQLTRPYIHESGDHALVIPVRFVDGEKLGFLSDGGTIPRPFWSIYERFGKFLPAFLCHDYRWSFRDDFPSMTFKDANDLLYADVFAIGDKVSAYTIYRAVQSFGRGIWDRGKLHNGDVSYHYARIQ
jgi:hypothetical protein